MLPNPQIREAYEKIVWVYVYRDFSGSESDRAAERISLRFGVTSWPQIFLADPESMKIVKHTGRSVESFLGAVNSTRMPGRRRLDAYERIRAAEARAVELEDRPRVALAKKSLDDDDIVVRTRALQILAADEPKTLVQRAGALLQVPNDPFRYAVCAALKDAGDPKANDALEAIVEQPRDSLNPNVLRIRAVQALGTCGDAGSVTVIAPHAQSGAYFNGLTGVSIDALVEIAKRHKKARAAVDEVLRQAYPRLPKAGEPERAMRACVALAKRVHKARGDKRAFPKTYDEKSRTRLMSK